MRHARPSMKKTLPMTLNLMCEGVSHCNSCEQVQREGRGGGEKEGFYVRVRGCALHPPVMSG